MYYAANNPGGVSNQDKVAAAAAGGIFIPGQGPYVTPAYPTPQQVLPNGLPAAARYAHGPQAFAVVSTPQGHPAYAPGLYSSYASMPYANLPRLPPTSTPAYIPAAGQFPGGIPFQTAALAGRQAQHTHYTVPTPIQAGAPLFAAGYTQLPPGMAATHGARSLPIGPPGYQSGFGFPAGAAATEGGQPAPLAYSPAGYMPQF